MRKHQEFTSRRARFHGPWSLILFVSFMGSAAATVAIVRFVAGLLH